jgi:hypothetical protein
MMPDKGQRSLVYMSTLSQGFDTKYSISMVIIYENNN